LDSGDRVSASGADSECASSGRQQGGRGGRSPPGKAVKLPAPPRTRRQAAIPAVAGSVLNAAAAAAAAAGA
jgi:hypothetical protein